MPSPNSRLRIAKTLGWVIGTVAVVVFVWAITTGVRLGKPREAAEARARAAILAYTREGDVEACRAGLFDALRIDPSYAAARYNLGVLAEEQEDWNAAIEWFEKYTESDDVSERAALAREKIERARKLRDHGETPEQRRERRIATALGRAMHLLDKNQPGGAFAAAERLASVESDRYEPYAIGAMALAQHGAFEEARRFAALAVERAPQAAQPALHGIARELEREVEFSNAIDSAEEARARRDFPKAAASYQEAWSVFPEREQVALDLALVLGMSNAYGLSAEVLAKLRDSSNSEVAAVAKDWLAGLEPVLAAARLRGETEQPITTREVPAAPAREVARTDTTPVPPDAPPVRREQAATPVRVPPSELYPYREGRRYGFLDASGRVVIENRFEAAGEFSEKRAHVQVDGRYGFVDAGGALVITPRFEGAGDFSEGLAPVKQDGRWGHIDAEGRMIVSPEFTRAFGFKEGLARVATGGLWGYVDRRGGVAIAPRFSQATDFSGGLAAVRVGSKWGYVDASGTLVVPARFDGAESAFAHGPSRARLGRQWGYVNRKGEFTIEPTFEKVSPGFSAGRAFVKKAGRWGIIDEAGAFVLAPRFDEVGSGFSEGLAAVRIERKWGFVNRDGIPVIAPRFDEATAFRGKRALVTIDGRRAYIDATGRTIWQSPS